MSDAKEVECPSPFGVVKLHVLEGRLVKVLLCQRAARGATGAATVVFMAAPFAELLRGYFRGSGIFLDADALDLSGISPFGQRVLRELTKVRFGQVVTYGELAARVGAPRAARAVGQAVARNPLPIFVPCHRVVAAGHRLGGFSAGLKWKGNLLSHEGWSVKEGKIVKRETANDGPRTCVYAGSFDPPTMGHMHMIEKGAAMFDRLIVSVGINPNKKCTFSVADRLEMLRRCTDGLGNVEVDSFEGQFLVHYAESKGAGYVLRGIRSE
ncbi:MAG: methylated-DNA--[protein]-cysteine S-methyltransferase, partial [Planctomycetota bacterium]